MAKLFFGSSGGSIDLFGNLDSFADESFLVNLRRLFVSLDSDFTTAKCHICGGDDSTIAGHDALDLHAFSFDRQCHFYGFDLDPLINCDTANFLASFIGN